MNDHNLDDLIIGEPDSGNKGSKSLLTLVGLILIILIVGVFLAKLILGGPDVPQEAQETELTGISKPAAHPAAKPRQPTASKSEALPEELQPISKETLPSTEELTPIHPPVTAKVPSKPHIVKQTPKTQSTPKAKVSVSKPKPKPKVKKSPKELFAKQSRNKKPAAKTATGTRQYFIQLGSFKRMPDKKFLDKIKARGYKPIIVKAGEMIKVRVGPYGSYADAKAKLPTIKDQLGISGFVVRKQ
ncbi:SPOR domain-containing protein [Nitratifractor salsuginis]|uniref:Sporulation domain-containing protein n=1 Tax=Nitratifractor salsuginis (strain DSM 16511 / JCM 12458 / E9I37-1) TaxID=749222 RepID=E6X0X4_NITSE|nr:SPOR domain-containing protein [Nitratifractor salsuginis]ADV46906.1 Sporulation domain-containing protein [Nitratifractor salsuginis DSM 16511]